LMDNVCLSACRSSPVPLHLMFRMQAAEHVTQLTFVFTTLVLIAATQGKQQDQYSDYAI